MLEEGDISLEPPAQLSLSSRGEEENRKGFSGGLGSVHCAPLWGDSCLVHSIDGEAER